ncbi:TNT domain-containing protein [Nonomuraea sp. NPDC046802]|uniref:TNT domain-containing protein n=1 Tax=Nonomuraea sp. NPDC046802 TaxID=3154919 RepID=UPI00340406F9
MRYHRRSAVLAAAICATAGLMGSVAAHADQGEDQKGSVQAVGQVCGPPYVTGDPDLGPTLLPRTGYLGQLLQGYVPLGGLSPQHFLSRYWDYVVNNYRFPPDAGFGRSGDYPNGRLELKTTFLQIGMKLDRFGGYSGAFLSPLGDRFTLRALPPRNLNTNPQDPAHLCNYHAFRVLKSFRVDVGPAAPAFQQPGGGTQYHVLSKYIPEAPQTSDEVPVSWLLQNGYLEEIEPVIVTELKPRHDEAGQIDRPSTDRTTHLKTWQAPAMPRQLGKP